ncbi:MAG: hypothetical protein LW696_07285 [Alphaproteobacteria bacterium]|jgi:hypothetical protein|nr:hypothetical protein [Alphaproteobacteria bacterium]
MSTLSMSKADQAICDEFNLYEYGISHLVTMPNNYKFIIGDLSYEEFEKLENSGAKIELLTELGG